VVPGANAGIWHHPGRLTQGQVSVASLCLTISSDRSWPRRPKLARSPSATTTRCFGELTASLWGNAAVTWWPPASARLGEKSRVVHRWHAQTAAWRVNDVRPVAGALSQPAVTRSSPCRPAPPRPAATSPGSDCQRFGEPARCGRLPPSELGAESCRCCTTPSPAEPLPEHTTWLVQRWWNGGRLTAGFIAHSRNVYRLLHVAPPARAGE